jgi:hypothetical protein
MYEFEVDEINIFIANLLVTPKEIFSFGLRFFRYQRKRVVERPSEKRVAHPVCLYHFEL